MNQAHTRHNIEIQQAEIADKDGHRAETARRRDAGRALVNAAQRDLVALGIARNQVCVTADSNTAHGSRTHMGWEDRADIQVYSFFDEGAICNAN